LVLILSNWSFVRDNKETKHSVRCSLHDVTVGFKISSSEFRSSTAKPPNPQNPYDFDKNGLILPYPAFLSLAKDHSFAADFMKKVQSRYTADTGIKDFLPSPSSSSSSTAAATAAKADRPAGGLTKRTLRRKYNVAFPELEEEERVDGQRSGNDDDDDDDDDDGDEPEPEDDVTEDPIGGQHKRAAKVTDYSEADEINNEFDDLATLYNESEDIEATSGKAPATSGPFPNKPPGQKRPKQQPPKKS
jgi:hypothetical protein